jgi:hypothetical protein
MEVAGRAKDAQPRPWAAGVLGPSSATLAFSNRRGTHRSGARSVGLTVSGVSALAISASVTVMVDMGVDTLLAAQKSGRHAAGDS